MMALAIDELRPADGEPVVGEIAVFGVDMEAGTEYQQQRGGFRHFMDLARFLGIRVTRLADTGLSYEPIPYPLWQDDPLLAKLARRERETSQKIATLDRSIKETRALLAGNAAITAEVARFRHPDYDPDKADEALRRERENLLKTSADMSREMVSLEGQAAEQGWLRAYLTP